MSCRSLFAVGVIAGDPAPSAVGRTMSRFTYEDPRISPDGRWAPDGSFLDTGGGGSQEKDFIYPGMAAGTAAAKISEKLFPRAGALAKRLVDLVQPVKAERPEASGGPRFFSPTKIAGLTLRVRMPPAGSLRPMSPKLTTRCAKPDSYSQYIDGFSSWYHPKDILSSVKLSEATVQPSGQTCEYAHEPQRTNAHQRPNRRRSTGLRGRRSSSSTRSSPLHPARKTHLLRLARRRSARLHLVRDARSDSTRARRLGPRVQRRHQTVKRRQLRETDGPLDAPAVVVGRIRVLQGDKDWQADFCLCIDAAGAWEDEVELDGVGRQLGGDGLMG
ncbi:uncharacterized protein VDAG_05385 [Verticillium dahliae VdLs.17]|uniref:Uncharacterized protein n=1 Tax=Verticillium dahliae (strain VdLs.17 / ATCC MYA-4575 / FGSC 10137) TaxID=498257 RepID=G2X580_VERDV|nr:uncharacterized protein VDAG_05385 [Verticillium dahliae VdLs.17]EGY14221.1 hypothetical protein VDAG_05385 [Verticillium dahliae VdLs.17]KAH6701128.1 hypothetical protein EV126DRAFT_442408 [Verticillium dahliae]